MIIRLYPVYVRGIYHRDTHDLYTLYKRLLSITFGTQQCTGSIFEMVRLEKSVRDFRLFFV